VAPDRVLLVGQYRHLLREISWELPGGGAGPDEDPRAAAQRELREEGGYRAGRFDLLTRFFPSKRVSRRGGLLLRGLGSDAGRPARDDDEFIERRVVPLADAVRMAVEGEITESVSKVTLLQYLAGRNHRG